MQHVVCNKEAEIASLSTDMAHVKSDMSATRQDIGDIKRSLLGNGVPGIATRLAKAEQVISLAIWIGGVAVVAVIGLVVDMLKRGGK